MGLILTKEKQMSLFNKLSQTILHFQYHIAWVPKDNFRILGGEIEVENCIRSFPSSIILEMGQVLK